MTNYTIICAGACNTPLGTHVTNGPALDHGMLCASCSILYSINGDIPSANTRVLAIKDNPQLAQLVYNSLRNTKEKLAFTKQLKDLTRV